MILTPDPTTRRLSTRRLVVAAIVGTFLAATLTPHVAGLVLGILIAATIVAPWRSWGRRLAAVFDPPAPPLHLVPDEPAPRSSSLVAIDAELAGRRLRPLTPGQRAVIQAWAARHLAPYEPFPYDDDEAIR